MSNIPVPLFVQEEIPIRSDMIRRFKIESITGYTSETKNGMQLSNSFRSYSLTYDHLGNQIRQEKYNSEGKKIQVWEYDEKGRLQRETAYDTSGRVNYRLELIYNGDEDWQEKQMWLANDRLHYRIVANRDVNGCLLDATYYDSSDQNMRTDSYVYDERGELLRMNMGHMGEWVYEYDENENLKMKVGNLTSGNVYGESYTYEYNNLGLLIKINELHYSTTILNYHFQSLN